jgi:hypothetical protein
MDADKTRFDFLTLRRCGAKRRAGTPCKRAGRVTNGRCKLHGGATHTKHGRCTKAAMAQKRRVHELIREARAFTY